MTMKVRISEDLRKIALYMGVKRDIVDTLKKQGLNTEAFTNQDCTNEIKHNFI